MLGLHLGNRCAIDWILEQAKTKPAKDATIRNAFATPSFMDRKDAVTDLLERVATVSVRTIAIIQQMNVLDGAARNLSDSASQA